MAAAAVVAAAPAAFGDPTGTSLFPSAVASKGSVSLSEYAARAYALVHKCHDTNASIEPISY